MQYVFERIYVGADNKGFVRGTAVPADFDEVKLRFLLADGIVKAVEGMDAFLQKVAESPVVAEVVEITPVEVDEPELDEVERLDPEKKRRKR